MWKDKVKVIVDYIVKHSKIVFPVLVIAAVAATVSLALSANGSDKLESANETISTTESVQEATEEVTDIAPMALNDNQAVTTLLTSFYNAMALGDAATLNSICDAISTKDMLRYQELAKYIEMYPIIEIYTKPGYDEGSTIAFVYYKVVFSAYEDQYPGYAAHYLCTNEQGELYIKASDISDEANEYIGLVMSQDDVVEFHNRVTVEYNELMDAKPELLEYLSEMDAQVSAAVGVALAQENATEAQPVEENPNAAGTEGTTAEGGEVTATEGTQEVPAEPIVQYATATTTVNVRSSDSEQADKLGKVAGGEKLQILEQKVNGWTKVMYEGKDGYIKSEYLELVESADGAAVVGKVTATTNVNVRASMNEDADKLGVMVGGDTADLLANENGWCKINYNGQVGYVKADYLEMN